MALLSLLLLLATDEWEKVEEENGVLMERRPVKGKKLDELRISTSSKLAVVKLCDAVWGDGAYDKAEPGLKSRKMLEDKGKERLMYEQIATPVVSDRDYTILARRMEDEKTGICQVFFETKNDRGPPPQKDHVRIPIIYGSWTFEPGTNGGTEITYFIYSDPGGGIPIFLIKGAQKKNALKWLDFALTKAAGQKAK